jgi:hypothetical protein
VTGNIQKNPRGRPRIYVTRAEAREAYRKRHGLVRVSLDVPGHLVEVIRAVALKLRKNGKA